MQRRVAVLGGGAAGMTAAIWASDNNASVTIYEKNDRVGKKILATGNGRCNFSNEAMESRFFHGSGTVFVDTVLSRFDVERTKAFFSSLGMRIKDRDGYLYPASDQASTVLDLLRFELARKQVAVHTGTNIKSLSYSGKQGKFLVGDRKEDGLFDAVILACGGCASPNTGSDGNGFELAKQFGHRIVTPVPALVALRCKEKFYKQVSGVRCEAALTLYVSGNPVCFERGELQLTDYGISGIPTFQISGFAARALQEGKHVEVGISFLPDFDEEEREAFFETRLREHGEDTMEIFLTGLVNKKINLLLLKLAGIEGTKRAKDVPAKSLKRLQAIYGGLNTEIVGTNGFEKAQISAGGVDCSEVTDNLMSKRQRGLYFAGEILDIDGICGGYNLQWAWSSGAVAGSAAAHGIE